VLHSRIFTLKWLREIRRAVYRRPLTLLSGVKVFVNREISCMFLCRCIAEIFSVVFGFTLTQTSCLSAQLQCCISVN
jgi:hypothetical protein